MELFLRILRILATVLFCAIAFAVALQLLTESENFRTPSYYVGVALFLLYYVPFMLLLATAILTAMDRYMVRKLWPYVLFWLFAGSAAAVKTILALPVAALTGVLYWALTGRVAGTPGFSIQSIRRSLLIGKLAAAPVVLYITYVLANWAAMGGKMLWVTAFPPDLGDPPFVTEYEREMTSRVKVAIMDYPDAQACVAPGHEPVETDKLIPIDWNRIDSEAAAEVCIFRVLAAYGDLSGAGDWLDGQGFQMVRSGINPEEPYVHVGQNGTLRVTGNWSIKENGLLYKPDTLFFHAMASIAYTMSVDAWWSEDGQNLLWVDVGYLTL